MITKDSRRLAAEEQHELRLRVVSLLREGKSRQDVAAQTGVNPCHVSTIWQKYLKGGEEALRPIRRGRREGEKRKLSQREEAELWNTLLKRTPRELQIGGWLWTREAVGRAAKGLKLRSVTDYLRRRGVLLPKPPLRRPEELPRSSAWWLGNTFPCLAARARECNADAWWFSDSPLPSGCDAGSGEVLLLAAVDNSGKVRFMFCQGELTARVFVRFLSRLSRDNGRKVFLVMCVQPLSPRKVITTWLVRHRERLELAYMPPNSPLLPRGTEPYSD